jgi:hypothetical protein
MHFLKSTKDLIGGLTIVLLTSCGTVFTTSSEPQDNATSSKPLVGSYYFLPKARIAIDGTLGKDGATYAITITQTNEPDRDHRYFLKYKGNSSSEDTYTLSVDSKGLLTTVSLQAEDKSPAVINKVADTIVSAISAAENVAGFVPGEKTETTEKEEQHPFSVVFDPQDQEELSEAISVINRAGFLLTANPEPTSSHRTRQGRRHDKEIVSAVRQASSSELENRSSEGVFFHPPTTVTLKVAPKNKKQVLLTKTTDLQIPDKHQIAIFDLRRLALVKRTTNLTFSEGALTTVGETRPSQVLAGVTIPADLAAKAASAIPALIKIQNDTANAAMVAETARLKAKTDLLDQETARLKATVALAQQRASTHAASATERDAARTALEHAQAENAKAQTELIHAKAQNEGRLQSPVPAATPTVSPSPTTP